MMSCEKCGTTKGVFYPTLSGVMCDTCEQIRFAFAIANAGRPQNPKYNN